MTDEQNPSQPGDDQEKSPSTNAASAGDAQPEQSPNDATASLPPTSGQGTQSQPVHDQSAPEQPVYDQAAQSESVYDQATQSQPVYDQAEYERQLAEYYQRYGYPQASEQYAGQQQTASQPEPDYAATYGYQAPPEQYAAVAAEDSASSSGRRSLWAGVVAGVVAGLIFGVVGAMIGVSLSDGKIVGSSASQSNPANPNSLSPRTDNSVAAIAKAVLPTAVTVVVESGGSGGTGSGFVYNSDGYIITNNHVISAAAGGGRVAVRTEGAREYQAKIVGRSVSYDIAVLKIDAPDLQAAAIGNSASVVIGDAAIAIGSPLGLDGTVTSGIISALNRSVTAGGQGEASFISALQTDAAINPGNSGGPLVNAEGQVIGVNSAIATLGDSDSSGNIGLGFAIPINTAKRIADEIIATGRSTLPIIGVNVNMQYSGNGAQISRVEPGSPAASAGLRPNEIITAVNGQPVTSPSSLLSTLRSFNPGDTVTLTVTSPNGEGQRDVKVTLGSRQE